MNNALVLEQQVDKEIDVSPMYRQREIELTQVIEAFGALAKSNFWKTAKTYYDAELTKYTNLLRNEKDTTEIFRLQGKVSVLEKLIDLPTVTNLLLKDLERIRSNLKEHGKEK